MSNNSNIKTANDEIKEYYFRLAEWCDTHPSEPVNENITKLGMEAFRKYYSQLLSQKIKDGIRRSKERKAALQNAKTNENKGV